MATPCIVNGLPVGGDIPSYNLSSLDTCVTSQPSLLPDGSGWHEQQVFYATERDYCTKKHTYGTHQMQQLRYGSALVRIPKLREPGKDMAYRIPFAVRHKKNVKNNGRYFITLYDHHTGKPLKLEDFEPQVKDKQINRCTAESTRKITAHVPDVFRCCCGVPDQEGRCREQHVPSEARVRFLNEVKAAVRASARRELVVFVHGYNVDFEACIKSAAQVTFDTSQDYGMIDCPGHFEYRAEQRAAVAFDWASNSRLMAYGFVPCVQDDRERAAEAGPKLAHLLLDLAAKMKELEAEGSSCNGIHIVAHSMGNYVTHYAIEHLGNKPDCADDSSTAAAAAAAAAASGPGMVAEVGRSPSPSAAAAATAGGYAIPELLPPLATVREESGSLTAIMMERAAPKDDVAAAAAAEDAGKLQQAESAGQEFDTSCPGQAAVAAAAAAAAETSSGAVISFRSAGMAAAETPAVRKESRSLNSNEAACAHAAATPSSSSSPPSAAAAAAGGYASPELLPPLATVREESGSLTANMMDSAAPKDDVAAAAAAAAAAAEDAGKLQQAESAGNSSPCAHRPHSFLTPFAHPHHNVSCQPHAAAASSSSSAAGGVVPHKFTSFAVAEEEPSDGAKRLALYDSSQVVLVHKQCLLRSRKAQHLMQLTKTIILAAADVSRHDLIKTIRQVKVGAAMHCTAMPHITLYCSRRDQALAVSSVLRVLGLTRTDGRAGFFMRKPKMFEGHLFHPFLFNDVTSVDCTGFSADWLGHGYFREHRQVLTDMSQAFNGITSTKLRTAIKAAKDGEPWKCMACNDVVIKNKTIELYTVMTVEEQHQQQLQLLRRQIVVQREQLQQLAGCQTFEQWQQRQQVLQLQQQLCSPSQRMPL